MRIRWLGAADRAVVLALAAAYAAGALIMVMVLIQTALWPILPRAF